MLFPFTNVILFRETLKCFIVQMVTIKKQHRLGISLASSTSSNDSRSQLGFVFHTIQTNVPSHKKKRLRVKHFITSNSEHSRIVSHDVAHVHLHSQLLQVYGKHHQGLPRRPLLARCLSVLAEGRSRRLRHGVCKGTKNR